MSENRHSPIAEALRKAGYLPLPRLWVRAEDMEKIHAIAHKAKDVVNSIRGEVRRQHGDGAVAPLPSRLVAASKL